MPDSGHRVRPNGARSKTLFGLVFASTGTRRHPSILLAAFRIQARAPTLSVQVWSVSGAAESRAIQVFFGLQEWKGVLLDG